MPPDRLSLRLGQLPHNVLAELLPHNVLAELAARLCSESPALQAAAEECMAAHKPLPHELVERVLLSPDLVPHILGPLEAEDGAAAAACSQWLVGWKATNEAPWRRRLKQVPLDFPFPEEMIHMAQMAGTPDGRLVVCAREEVHILDRSMRVLQTTVNGENEACTIAANDDSIFYATYTPPVVRRSSHDGTVDAEYQLEDYNFYGPVLAPGAGLVFCHMFEEFGLDEQLEIIALDAQTLQLRHRFGLGLLNGPAQLAVVGEELYACDTGNHRLQVFSLTGEHRRSITGEWRSPLSLCFAKDRLYLVERDWKDEEHEVKTEDPEEYGEYGAYGDPEFPLQGRRIIVLSLQGDILQVFTHPTEHGVFTSICCFDHKLLASYTYGIYAPQGFQEPPPDGMFALRGL